MADTTLRVRSTSEIVDASFALYRRDFLQYVMIGALAYSPLIIVFILLQGMTSTTGLLVAGITYLVTIVCLALVSGMIAKMGSDVYLGGTADVAATMRAVMPRVPSLLLATVLVGVIVMFGLFLLIVPGVYLYTRLFAVPQMVVLEGLGPMEAIGRSWALTKGHGGHTFLTLLLVYGIYFVISIGVTLTTLAMGSVVVQTVSGMLLGILCYPILTLVALVLYYDLRIRTEGFDVEHMASTLGADPYSGPAGNLAI
ncbi:MAG TPA: hypothetical protein VE869_01090 [Gemmatimonas sp.]|nr:hypothetical protein [Gemmatimonas sp.]